MRLFLLRHAKAHPGHPDENRALTESGRARMVPVAEWLNRHDNFGLEVAHHSTLRRARETAEELNLHLTRPLKLREIRGLAPEDSIGPWLERLGNPKEDLLLIGHNPFLTMLAGALLDLPEPFPFNLRKSAMAVLRHYPSHITRGGIWELLAWMPSAADPIR